MIVLAIYTSNTVSDEVAVHEVKVCSVNDAELRVSWPEAPDADSYELTVIINRGLNTTWYNVTTTVSWCEVIESVNTSSDDPQTAVILSGFNMTHSYSIRVSSSS